MEIESDTEGACHCPRDSQVVWHGSRSPRLLRESLRERGFALHLSTDVTDSNAAVHCFGDDVTLQAIAAALEGVGCPAFVIRDPHDRDAYDELLADDRITYVVPTAVDDDDVVALISALAGGRRIVAGPHVDAAFLRRIALAQSPTELRTVLRSAIAHAARARDGRVLFHDVERRGFWSDDPESLESTASGIAGFVLHTGLAVASTRAGGDARFDRSLDLPHGSPDDRLLAVAVRGATTTVAVLVATRDAAAPAFELRDLAALEALAVHAAPFVDAWIGPDPRDADDAERSPFRVRARRQLELPHELVAEPLHLDGRWSQRTTWLALATLVAVLAVVLAGRWM